MIVSCGESLIDCVPMSGRNGESGFRPCVGGSPYNVAIATARLGGPAGFLGRISTDFFGDMLMSALEANGVDRRFIVRRDQPSTLGFVSLEDEEPQYAFYSNGAADRMLETEDLPAAFPADVECLQFGSISLMQEPAATTLESLMRREHCRRTIALDPNIRPRLIADREGYVRRLESWVALTDLIKVSGADLDWLYPGEAVEGILERWLTAGPRLIVVTMGTDGALGATERLTATVSGASIQLVDTVGAGDTFHGALLARLHALGDLAADRLGAIGEGDLRDALSFANRAAAVTCSRQGNDPPRLQELAAS